MLLANNKFGNQIFVARHSNSGTVAYWTQESGDCIFLSLHGCLLQVSDPLLYEPVPKGAPSDISICGLALILMVNGFFLSVWPTLQRRL